MLSGPAAALVLAAVLAMSSVVAAQPVPTALGTDVTTAVELSPQQTDAVQAYVMHWANVLNNERSTPADVEQARDRLAQPFTQPGGLRTVSPNFRGTFSRFALPEMEKAIRSGNVYRAVNAIRVISAIASDRASASLLEHADSLTQPSWEIRMRAADGERLLLLAGTLDARRVLEAARKLRDASMRETDGLVLRNLFAALVAADSASLPSGDRTIVRTLLGEAMASAAQRVAGTADVSRPMLLAMGSAVANLRVRITTFTQEEQQQIGARLGPALGRMLDWSRANWDAVKQDPHANQDMATFVAAAEGLLQFFDPVLLRTGGASAARPTPSSDMRSAWIANDKSRFESGVQAWQAVLGKAPYRP